MSESSRIRFVTANYSELQGLRFVPLGVFLLVLAASAAGWLDLVLGSEPHIHRRWLGGAFCLALLGATAATAQYRHRYGCVVQFGRAGRNGLIGLAILAFLAFAQLDLRLHGPFAFAALWVAVCLLLTYCEDGPIRAHFVLGALPWLVVAMMPAFGARPDAMLVGYYTAGGLALLICGIGDHLLVSRTLPVSAASFHGNDPRTV